MINASLASRYDLYIDRLVERMVETSLRGITFEEFRDFCSFLNQLEDFAIAMRMYTMADQPISQGESRRRGGVVRGRHAAVESPLRISRHSGARCFLFL